MTSYYQNEYRRSAFNLPIDTRRVWRWRRDPSDPPPGEPDVVSPYFGEDLVVE